MGIVAGATISMPLLADHIFLSINGLLLESTFLERQR